MGKTSALVEALLSKRPWLLSAYNLACDPTAIDCRIILRYRQEQTLPPVRKSSRSSSKLSLFSNSDSSQQKHSPHHPHPHK
ncbi:hypothetical protein PAXRUDRAFT_824286 [Paxillus rubicundulus Ve08.2h10]|uniref:Uncharacterized protein n=1 Tax=Paxillus rubicundulus Ve08.2h10 TaxID=930991 RepID=A0A0D0DIB8_9AGAM|nr:hypothetical protein PAXRUDRAFT_824286 [Paxillus rubicundulus Ve08.2h10]